MRPLVFIDTETVSLKWNAPVWEIGAIRRDEDGSERCWQLMLDDVDLSEADPQALAIGRYHERCKPRKTEYVYWCGPQIRIKAGPPFISEMLAAEIIEHITRDAILVGVNVSFDAERLGHMLRRHDLEPAWYYTPLDLKSMATGYMHLGQNGLCVDASSRELSLLCGAEPPSDTEAHTAMGDALWVKRWYDAMTQGAKGRA